MSAYATAQIGRTKQKPFPASCAPPKISELASRRSIETAVRGRLSAPGDRLEAGLLDTLIVELADRVAAAVVAQLTVPKSGPDEWLDCRRAADYLGIHRDTLRKLAAERAVPAEQDGPGCKLFFRRADLDEWRRTGGRSAHLSSVLVGAE